jgi:holo-[acyl-carrier protein] synthase
MSLGVDVVDVERFRRVLERSPTLVERFFTPGERAYCETKADPVVRFAGTLAAKEAAMKALNLTPAPAWARRIEIVREQNAAPTAEVVGRRIEISISHDGGLAIAAAMATGVI